MKQYQVYFRQAGKEGWHYGDTYSDPAVAWAAMQLARAKGMVARCITAGAKVQGIDHTVLANG
jgi:hypothetical protein